LSAKFRHLPKIPRDLAPIALVWLVGLAIAASLFFLIRSHYVGAERERFQREAVYASTVVTETLERHINSLRSLRAFVASRQVTRWEFSSFAAQILPSNHGFKAVLWVPRVTGSERKAYEARFERDGLYGLRIREVDAAKGFAVAGARPAYLPVTYVEPLEGNQDLIGLDLATAPGYADVLALAEHTNGIAVSRLPSPRQNSGSILVAFPLSASGTAATAPASSATRGFAVGILDLGALVTSVIPKGSPYELIVQQIAGENTDANARLELDAWLSDSRFSQSRAFSIANQKFVVAVRSSADENNVAEFLIPLVAALGTILLTGLLAQYIRNAKAYRRKVESAVIARTAELNAANAALRDEIELRRQAEGRLLLEKDKSEIANRAKSAFLATMSHRLRAPLNVLIGLSETMIREVEAGNGAARIRSYVDNVNSSGLTLLQLVNELLDLSQLDSEDVTLKEEVLGLTDLIRGAADRVRLQAKNAGIALSTHCPDDTLSIRADERLLSKALTHLLSNAIRFTPAGGSAELFVQNNVDGTVSLVVRDNGIGIPKDKIEHVLEPFVRLPNELSTEREGAGLGLAFVRRVADLSGFSLSIESEKGVGTRVSLTCPRERLVRRTRAA